MTESIFDVTGRVALVTGASSGFGEHFARVLSSHGANVIVGARRMDRLEGLVDELTSSGAEALAVALDVTDPESVKAAFDAAECRFGVVDIVANNAGLGGALRAVEVTEDEWHRVLETNVTGVWRVATEAARRLIAAGKTGSIVNVASILGFRVAFGYSSYATSKAAVIQLTRSLALEWGRKNIRVNALCPGYFITEMNQHFFNTERGRAYIATMPAARTGEMEEITAPFMLLASDAGSYVNGVALPVDGAHGIANL